MAKEAHFQISLFYQKSERNITNTNNQKICNSNKSIYKGFKNNRI